MALSEPGPINRGEAESDFISGDDSN
jgi:hypothetical protein